MIAALDAAAHAAGSGGSGTLTGPISFGDVGLSVFLVVIAVAASRWRRLGLERDMVVATGRSFVQLVAVGYVLDFVFGGQGWLTPIVLSVMVATAAWTSGSRARQVPGSYLVAVGAIVVGTAGTLGVLGAFRIVPLSARAVIPLGSMVITSVMNTTSLVMTRLRDDLAASRREVEARLSLGQTSYEASLPWHRQALRSGMLPSVDQTKVVGLVALPGAMTGMILAGASPLAAIRLQLVVMYMLLGGNAFAALVAAQLTVRRLFTPAHQLIRSLRQVPD
ncbi:iron export ABC transporter permease subunit FetB [Acidiferrimicrobium sp. IK]|uniref:ABC transporter permease n=1 Tax=Acidiferrimicrobium sp. IK TaxID=2871700 RepID=UPI0021CB37EA|nr:iron export ABC transporter permease subunit FetB [Acidiferrimicrobium sp. IK]MCU4184118.1 iron export ABC transporter permease subunit FetB [Acidiferrimicrobium sp. IK]